MNELICSIIRSYNVRTVHRAPRDGKSPRYAVFHSETPGEPSRKVSDTMHHEVATRERDRMIADEILQAVRSGKIK